MVGDRRYREALGALMLWSRDVATLTLGIGQILFAGTLIFTLYDSQRVHSFMPSVRVFEIFVFVTFLRILLRP